LPPDVEQALTNRFGDLFELFYRQRDKIVRVTLWGVLDGSSLKNGYPVPGRTN
jgi:endo-1,4-beta-xylanase